MICPKCHAEYIDEETTCSTCREPLLEKLEPENTKSEYHLEVIDDSAKFVTIYKTGNHALLTMIKSLLEADHIEYYIKGYDGIFEFSTEQAEVMVDEKNRKDALSLLSELDASGTEDYPDESLTQEDIETIEAQEEKE